MFSSLTRLNLIRSDLKQLIPRLDYSSKVAETTSVFSANYENKNPRNLEWSGHQYKRFGWNLQYPPKDFYHQCSFRKVRNYLEATVEHSSGEIIAKASTQEVQLLQYLTSPRDMCAAVNLGRLLADRCVKYGLTNMHYLKSISFESSKREQAFYQAMIESGIVFEEPEFIESPDQMPGLDYDNKNFYTDKKNLPLPSKSN